MTSRFSVWQRTTATAPGPLLLRMEKLSVSSFRAAFDLLTSIQDEVHRFSIGYSRSKHASRAMESVLRSVEGIGEKRAKNLFLRFEPKGNGGCHCGAAGGNAGYDPPDCP